MNTKGDPHSDGVFSHVGQGNLHLCVYCRVSLPLRDRKTGAGANQAEHWCTQHCCQPAAAARERPARYPWYHCCFPLSLCVLKPSYAPPRYPHFQAPPRFPMLPVRWSGESLVLFLTWAWGNQKMARICPRIFNWLYAQRSACKTVASR